MYFHVSPLNLKKTLYVTICTFFSVFFLIIMVLNQVSVNIPHSSSVQGQQAVPGNHPIPAPQVTTVSDCVVNFYPAPAIAEHPIPDLFFDVFEDFRTRSYDDIASFFEAFETIILRNILTVDEVKVLSNEVSQRLVVHLKDSLKTVPSTEIKKVSTDTKLTAAIFDALRRILEGISVVFLEDYESSVQSLVSWSSTLVCSKIWLQALKLDRYIHGTEIPSRSDITTGIVAVVSHISAGFRHAKANNNNHNTHDPKICTQVASYNLTSEDESFRRRKFAEDRVSKIEIIDRTPWSGQEDSLKRNYFHFKLRFLDSLELHELFQEPEAYFLYFLRSLTGVAKDIVSEHLRNSTFTEASAKVQCIWQILESEYNTEFAKREVTKEWRSILQLRDENLSTFANRFLRIQRVYSEATKIYPSDRELITAFHEGLQNSELKADLIRNVSIENMTFSSFRAEVIRRSQALIDIAKISKNSATNVIDLNASHAHHNSHSKPSFNHNKMNRFSDKFKLKSQSQSRYRSPSRRFNNYGSHAKNFNNSSQPRDNQECKRCGDTGHSAFECKCNMPIKSDTRCQVCGSFFHSTSQCTIDKRNISCGRCGTTGHVAAICCKKYADINREPRVKFDSNPAKIKNLNEVEVSNHSVLLAAVENEQVPLPTKTINLFHGDEFACSALIDSGADLSMVRPDLIEELKDRFNLEIVDLPEKVTVRVADNRKISHCSKILLKLSISKGSELIEIPMVVLPNLSRQCILSFDELRKVGIAWLATTTGDRIVRLPPDFNVSTAHITDQNADPLLQSTSDQVDKPLKSILKRRNSFSHFPATQTSETPVDDDPEFEGVVEMNRCEIVADETESFDLFSIKTDTNSKINPFPVERFKFRIPWKSNSRPSSGRSTALRLSTRLKNDLQAKGLFESYDTEIKNLVKIGAVKEVQDGYGKLYLSHFGVPTKGSSSFGGVRPVFNAKPLNKYLRKCAILHHSVLGNIFAFRKYENVRLWDFSKSFYQLVFTDDDTPEVDELVSEENPLGAELPFLQIQSEKETLPSEYLTFIWNNQEYAFVRVLMGGVSSPSHLQRAVEILKCDTLTRLDQRSIDRSSYIINMYMDDGVAGAPDPVVLDTVTLELNNEMDRRSLPDNPSKRFGLVDNHLEIGTERVPIDQSSTVVKSVTGLQWSMTTDTVFSDTDKISKMDYSKTYADFRKLSAMFYDPSGEYLEMSLIGRSILQKALNDEKKFNSVTDSTVKLMKNWKDGVVKLQSVPRTLDPSISDVLFCFADGSKCGIAAVLETLGSNVDQRVMARGNLCDETKAPRFELNSMVLVCETLLEFIQYGIYQPKLVIVCTDSLVTLSRLKSQGKRKECGAYEFNRLMKIRDSLKKVIFHGSKVVIKHIPGTINPADSPSRILPVDHSIREDLRTWKKQCVQNVLLDSNSSFQVCVDENWLYTLEQEKEKKLFVPLNPTEIITNAECNKVQIEQTKKPALFQTPEDIAHSFYISKLLKRTFHKWVTSDESSELEGYCNNPLSHLLHLTIRSQRHDRFCSEVLSPSTSKTHINRLRFESMFKVVDDIIFKRYGDHWLVFVPESEFILSRFIVKFFHNKCHGSAKFVEATIRQTFFIRSLTKIVNSIKFSCHTCLTCRDIHSPKYVSSVMKSPISQPIPWDYVGIDHVGPLPAAGHNRTVLVLTCMATGFIMCYASPSCDAHSTIKAMDNCFWSRGFPRTVKCDNGPAFRSRLFVEYCTLRNIRIRYATPYLPSDNGKLEASHKCLNSYLRILSSHKSCTWSSSLGEAQLLSNNKILLGNCTPFELMHTYKARLPYFSSNLPSWQQIKSVEEQKAEALKRYEEFVALDTDKARNKSVEAINSRSMHTEHPIRIGDTVYRRKFHRNKLSPYFEGPYTVFSLAGKHLAIKDTDDREYLSHVDLVKHVPNDNHNKDIIGEPFEVVKSRILARRVNDHPTSNNSFDETISPFDESLIETNNDVTNKIEQEDSTEKSTQNLNSDASEKVVVIPERETSSNDRNFSILTETKTSLKPKISKVPVKSNFTRNVDVKWHDENSEELLTGRISEIRPGIATVHRFSTDGQLRFVRVGEDLFPDLVDVDLKLLRRFQPKRF